MSDWTNPNEPPLRPSDSEERAAVPAIPIEARGVVPALPPQTRAAAAVPANPGPLGQDRSPGAVLGLSIITFGIYYLVWYGKLNAEIRRHDADIRVSPGWAVVAAIVPVVNIVSAYSTAARLRQMQLDDGQTQTISPVVALLLFLFLGIGFPLYLASQAREHWHGHRRQARAGG